MTDPRRRIPSTDAVLRDDSVSAAVRQHGHDLVKQAVLAAQSRAREGEIAPEDVVTASLEILRPAHALRRVLNATGVVVHTNVGRAPLPPAARQALVDASGYVDLELDLGTGERSRRGAGAEDALLARVPGAEAAMVVNNGAAALVLATTALAAGREVVVSRGELVEIGAGFRLPDLIASTGVTLREVGTTNRTHLADYRDAVDERTGCVLKVHPSNFRVEGFTSDVPVAELAGLRRSDSSAPPVVVDIGSGLLAPDRLLPQEPDASSALAAGAALVTASGDKLLGGPQAGLILGRAEMVDRLRRHPLARALRVDKLTLAALEATLRGPVPPVTRYRRLGPGDLRARTERLAAAVGGEVVAADGRVGGGGAPGHLLPGLAVALPGPARPATPAVAAADDLARVLRTGTPALLCRVRGERVLLDLRCIEPEDDDEVRRVVEAALAGGGHHDSEGAGR